MAAASPSGFFVLFILLQAGYFSAQPQYSAEEPPTVKEIEIQPARSSLTKLKEEIYNFPGTSQLKNTRTGGRTMMLRTVFNKEQQERKDTLNVEDAEISGKDIHASKKQSGKSQFLTQQNEWNKAASARRLADHTAGTHQDCFQHSSPASTRCGTGITSKPKRSLPYEPNDSYRHLESQKLTDARDEILNLMNMDYPTREKRGHKPPINNYDPLSKEHTKP